jgi:hypothetical protein
MAESPFLNPDPERVFHQSELAIGSPFSICPDAAARVARSSSSGSGTRVGLFARKKNRRLNASARL